MHIPDGKLQEFVDALDNEVKNIKHQVYKLSWYMRGGVDAHNLMYHTDIEDLGVLSKIVDENIEMSKKAGSPII